MGLQSPCCHHHSPAAFGVLMLGMVQVENRDGFLALGPFWALRPAGVHGEAELFAAGLAFFLLYFIFSLNFVVWSHPSVGLQEKVSFI